MRLQFINVLYSVNIYRGASGPRPISPVVQEVLSELKSMSTAKGEKSFFTASKKMVVHSGSVLNLRSQLIKRIPDGSIAITFCMHMQSPAHIFMYYTGGSVGFL